MAAIIDFPTKCVGIALYQILSKRGKVQYKLIEGLYEYVIRTLSDVVQGNGVRNV